MSGSASTAAPLAMATFRSDEITLALEPYLPYVFRIEEYPASREP